MPQILNICCSHRFEHLFQRKKAKRVVKFLIGDKRYSEFSTLKLDFVQKENLLIFCVLFGDSASAPCIALCSFVNSIVGYYFM